MHIHTHISSFVLKKGTSSATSQIYPLHRKTKKKKKKSKLCQLNLIGQQSGLSFFPQRIKNVVKEKNADREDEEAKPSKETVKGKKVKKKNSIKERKINEDNQNFKI